MDRNTVAQAKAQLEARGEPVIARAVRRVVGVGSHRDIARHLRALETSPPAPRLAVAQQAERAAVRAASFGQGTVEAVARAQTETRDAQHQVDQLARSLAARLVADGIQIAGPQAAGVYARTVLDVSNPWTRAKRDTIGPALASLFSENAMVQRRIYPDLKTQWRERKRRQRRAKKPYHAKRVWIRQHLEDLQTQALKAVQGVYDVVVIDPPWPVAFQARATRPQQVALAYPTMTVAAIQALRVPLADVAHVWLWTTHRFLPEALRCLAAWGLTYSCCFVWGKDGGMQPMGMPQFDCELVLYARKGPAVFLDTTNFKTLVQAPRAEHSAKPDAFYAMVRRVTAGRRLDMFARRPIAGFDSWGYDAPAPGAV